MESPTAFTIVRPVITAADFDVSLYSVERIGELARSILSFSYLVADGGRYTERSGDDTTDEGDLIIKKLRELELQIDHVPTAFERCRTKLAEQNDELSRNRNGAKPIVDARPYHSAHEAILALGRSLLAWFRAWETDLGDSVVVSSSSHRPAWSVAKLKQNLGDACKRLVDPQFQVLDVLTCSIAVATVDLWIFDAQYECRNSKAKLTNLDSQSGAKPLTKVSAKIRTYRPRFQCPPCPKCNGPAMVDGTKGTIRNIKCKNAACGHRWKVSAS